MDMVSECLDCTELQEGNWVRTRDGVEGVVASLGASARRGTALVWNGEGEPFVVSFTDVVCAWCSID